MNNFDIGITTFSLRYDFVESLVKSIRKKRFNFFKDQTNNFTKNIV